jgi:hypothetical protein
VRRDDCGQGLPPAPPPPQTPCLGATSLSAQNSLLPLDPIQRYDDEVRFDFFCKAALEFLLQTGRQPDIIHCHDWQTAHVAKSFWEDYHPFGLWKPKVFRLNAWERALVQGALFANA